MDIERLIERLRTDSLYADKASLEIMDLCMDAAAALEQVKREKDAAASDLESVMAYRGDNLDTCQFCKNGQCHVRGGTKQCLPQWRGQLPQKASVGGQAQLPEPRNSFQPPA